jgi:ribosomal protein L11 methyltransferase
VGLERAEEARATMLELFPHGFEEVDRPGGVELAAYTDSAGEERVWAFFGGARAADVEGGWEDKWRAFHRPARVGRLWVGPPWERPDPGLLAVVVDPGRAFGTGVLAIAAALLGFAPVLGVDVEEPSIAATRANAAANHVTVEARLVAPDERLSAAGAAVANISLESVERLPARIDADTLVTSGYFASEQPALSGYELTKRRTRDGWACDLHHRA